MSEEISRAGANFFNFFESCSVTATEEAFLSEKSRVSLLSKTGFMVHPSICRCDPIERTMVGRTVEFFKKIGRRGQTADQRESLS